MIGNKVILDTSVVIELSNDNHFSEVENVSLVGQ